MRVLAPLLLLATPLAVATAGCTRDTSNTGPRTLFPKMHIAALHFDETGGSANMNGQSAPILEVRIAIALCRWPSYTMAFVAGTHMDTPSTTYLASGSQTYHPPLLGEWSGIEVQKRWRDSSIFHPMVSVGVGELTTSYNYTHRDASGVVEYRTEGSSGATYFTPSAGVEVSLFKYVTSYLLVGVRKVGTLQTPAIQAGGFDGQYVAFGFGFGKFR